jgi:hypothetical protein
VSEAKAGTDSGTRAPGARGSSNRWSIIGFGAKRSRVLGDAPSALAPDARPVLLTGQQGSRCRCAVFPGTPSSRAASTMPERPRHPYPRTTAPTRLPRRPSQAFLS